jgi:hypothetical protein
MRQPKFKFGQALKLSASKRMIPFIVEKIIWDVDRQSYKYCQSGPEYPWHDEHYLIEYKLPLKETFMCTWREVDIGSSETEIRAYNNKNNLTEKMYNTVKKFIDKPVRVTIEELS